MRHHRPTKLIRLDNVSCPYCGVEFDSGIITEMEHVIGRKFVPKGSLAKQWNLVLRACEKCNDEKGELEGELSAITLQSDAFGEYPAADPLVYEEARRKGTAKSHRTGKSVHASGEILTFTGTPFPGVTMNFRMSGPPQADRDRVYTLAHYHVAAFFYLITFDDEKKRGVYWPGTFCPVLESSKSDWGNALMKGFMAEVSKWEERVVGTTANEFFQIMIRRHPKNILVWAWAVEWNKRRRIVGFCGEDEDFDSIVDALPKLNWQTRVQDAKGYVRSRIEEPLSEEDDILFLRGLQPSR